MVDRKVQLEIKNKIALVTMNRARKKNAFDESMFTALEQVTDDLKQNLPRVIIITGDGDEAFCAGFDVNPENPLVAGFLEVLGKNDIEPARRLVNRIRKAVDGFISLPVPIIAAINGLAYGGGMELATRCDLRVMDRTAQLCFSEVRLGLMPDWGGGPYLTKLVGSAIASDLILTARTVNAEEALKIGLVNRVSEEGRSVDEAFNLAELIAQNGPKAIRHALAVIRQSQDLSLGKALELEAEMAAELIVSGECIHGITAFMEKKKPEFPDVHDSIRGCTSVL
ncbi:MAG: enoyl-CoA hydratase/isomerase family protein [Deltaproteobacteria bacterium]|nr:enoyl-CoA hydratase/isomerase family protein [Deltaproteobacteria bacterium]